MFNTLRPRQNGRRFADDTFKRIFLSENVRILIKISLKFVPMGPINNNPALVQIMAWRRPGDKPLSEPVMVSLLTHICITRPQWVNNDFKGDKNLVAQRATWLLNSCCSTLNKSCPSHTPRWNISGNTIPLGYLRLEILLSSCDFLLPKV